jgi:nucleoside phosphorylase
MISKTKRQLTVVSAPPSTGLLVALHCLKWCVPQLEIRGISDFAGGDEKGQGGDPAQEKEEQERAALNACELACNTAHRLALAIVEGGVAGWLGSHVPSH